MTDPQPTAPPAGWYTDPSGQPGQRWWDGARWGSATQPVPAQQAQPVMPEPVQHVQQPRYPSVPLAPQEGRQQGTQFGYQPGSQPTFQPVQQPFQQESTLASYRPMQSFGAHQPMQSFGGAPSYGYGPSYNEVREINPSTEYMWRIAFWPLTAILTVGLYAAMGGLSYTSSYRSNTASDLVSALSAILLYLGLSVICYALFIRFALQDSRELRRRRLPEPFGWGWAFIPIVYVIGRTAVVYSRTGRGLAPLFVCIGVWLFTNVIGIPLVVLLTLASSGMYDF